MDPQSEPSKTDPEISPIEKLRSEFQEQFSTLQANFTKELETLKTKNEVLEKENSELHRALIRSAVTPSPTPEPEKTPEQIYEDKINAIAKRTLEMMKG